MLRNKSQFINKKGKINLQISLMHTRPPPSLIKPARSLAGFITHCTSCRVRDSRKVAGWLLGCDFADGVMEQKSKRLARLLRWLQRRSGVHSAPVCAYGAFPFRVNQQTGSMRFQFIGTYCECQ